MTRLRPALSAAVLVLYQMSLQLDDTIAALASPPGPAARGVVRISGPAVKQTLDDLFAPEDRERWQRARSAARHPGGFRLPSASVPLPVDVYLWPTRRSYTGQPSAELHTVGSPPLLEAVLSALFDAGVRPARPGEFTLRAFLSGRIDLTQAEAVLGVIDAADHLELETALRQLAGGLSGRLATIRGDLLDLLADLEAGLDFVDEDIEFVEQSEVVRRIESASVELNALLDQARDRMRSSGRPCVVLAGLPNAGKSTLFNALARRQAALVSEIRGTTRDYLSADVELGGAAVELVDTAGWEATAEGLMQQAQTSREDRMGQADLILWCTAADWDQDHAVQDDRLLELLQHSGRDVLVVGTKSDLAQPSHASIDVRISAAADAGLKDLADAVARRLSGDARGHRQLLGTTAARCRDSLRSAVDALEAARHSALSAAGDEIVALEVRDALDQLGHILGTVYTDDILDRIFSRFCIGK